MGIAGVAWKGAKLMALKFLDQSGGGRTSDAVQSMNYAAPRAVDPVASPTPPTYPTPP